MTEFWKSIDGTIYQVSNFGNVRNTHTGRILKTWVGSRGFIGIKLYQKYTFMIHKLVAEAFVDNPNGYTKVKHIDGDRKNNHASNLEWCPSSSERKVAIPLSQQKEDYMSFLETWLEDETKKRKEAEKEVKRLKTELNRLQYQSEKQREKIIELTKRDLTQENTTLKKSVSVLKGQVARLEKQLTPDKDFTPHNEEDYARLRKSCQKLVQDKKQLQTLVKKLEIEVEELNKKVVYRKGVK